MRFVHHCLKGLLALPHRLKIELKYLLDQKVLIAKQRTRIQKELEKLELTVNASRRVETLWKPMINTYKDYLKRLDELS